MYLFSSFYFVQKEIKPYFYFNLNLTLVIAIHEITHPLIHPFNVFTRYPLFALHLAIYWKNNGGIKTQT